MFIFLSKLLPLFVYPLGLACLLLLFALASRNNPRARSGLIIAALVILWFSSTTGFSHLLAQSLEWRYPTPVEIPTADVIVVLGGGTEPAAAPRPSVEVNGAGDRVLYAASLYKEGKAAHILLSGGNISWLNEGATTPAEDMASILSAIGIPKEALWLETTSQNTYENALYSKEILAEKEIDRILLITSAIHMPRSVALFEKQGIEVIPVPVDFSVTKEESLQNRGGDLQSKIIDIIPQASSLSLTTNAMKEYIGYFIYKLQGWL
ncbi:MAG: YdcF family protein [Anaerolineaceae bacterium]|nr:YdcF family protein [Anaerolineaceae bacterium]